MSDSQLLKELEALIEPERYELLESFRAWEFGRPESMGWAGGLIVALWAGEVEAQQPPRGGGPGGGRGTQEISAWLHIGEDSKITAFTGKVECGQNIRTSLTQVVAEELRVPVERIQ